MTEILTSEQIKRYRPDLHWPISLEVAVSWLFKVCDSHEALRAQLTNTLAQMKQVRQDAAIEKEMADAYIQDLQKQLANKQQPVSNVNGDKVCELIVKLDDFLDLLSGGRGHVTQE